MIIAKAIAAFVSGAILPFFAVFGVTGEMPFSSALEIIIFSLLNAGGIAFTVYFAPKNK